MNRIESDCVMGGVAVARTGVTPLRLGDWLLLPRPWMEVEAALILTDERACPGDERSPRFEWLYRAGGATAAIYVAGRVRRADSPTIVLPYWHRAVSLAAVSSLSTPV